MVKWTDMMGGMICALALGLWLGELMHDAHDKKLTVSTVVWFVIVLISTLSFLVMSKK